jgi:hypothetical protein
MGRGDSGTPLQPALQQLTLEVGCTRLGGVQGFQNLKGFECNLVKHTIANLLQIKTVFAHRGGVSQANGRLRTARFSDLAPPPRC